MPPIPAKLELEGTTFDVIRYEEAYHDGVGIERSILLRLTLAERTAFRKIYSAVAAKDDRTVSARVGDDGAPTTTYVLGFLDWWSRHDEAGTSYYKQALNLLPASFRPDTVPAAGLVLTEQFTALSDMVVTLALRVELLTEMLVKAGVIDQQAHAAIIAEPPETPTGDMLQDKTRAVDILWETRRIGDAAMEFGKYSDSQH